MDSTLSPPPERVENFRLAAALEYAGMGWPVLPLYWPKAGPSGVRCACGRDCGRNAGKHPLSGAVPHGLTDASLEPETVRCWWSRWPAANVGIVMGRDASGVVALDVDPRHGGAESLAELERRYGPIPPTIRAVTGGGGEHIFFRHPGVKVFSRSQKLAPGLDVKGDGGYVVAPPSLHASGGRYAWESLCQPGECEAAAVPGWLLGMMTDPGSATAGEPASRVRHGESPHHDAAAYWLEKAAGRAAAGNRNDTGLWLATQLRDAGVGEAEAESVVREYARRAPAGDDAYTEREAIASVRSAYRRPAREPARSVSYAAKVVRAVPVTSPATKPAGAAAELADHLEEFIDGRAYNVAWPWPQLTNMTQALLPGSVAVICGDPGVGKTFWVLQCLLEWVANDIPAAVFFIEKDRKFHTRRLLAQLEGDGRYVDFAWVRDHAETVRAALRRHAALIDLVGRHLYSAPAELVTLDKILGWVRQECSAGKRVLVVDPVTAAVTGVERWTADHEFVAACGRILTAHGSSLVLITHPKQGAARMYGGATSGHGMGGGAAYFRFSDTTVWLHRQKKPRGVRYQGPCGIASARLSLFAHLHKTRDGRGNGMEVGFTFGEGLKFVEQGVIIGDEDAAEGGDE